jgi:hypothetical protein
MRITPLAIAVLGLALAAGCSSKIEKQAGNAAPAGSATSPTAPTAGTSATATVPSGATGAPSTPPAEASGRCHTNQLRAEVDLIFPAGHAGSEQDAMLGLTNNGATCSMYGYVGMQLLDQNSQPRSTKVIRTDNGGKNRPTHFTLQHGQTAWAVIAWTFQPNSNEEGSDPMCGGRVGQTQITPPDETEHLTVASEFGTVCNHGTIYARPMSLTRPQP